MKTIQQLALAVLVTALVAPGGALASVDDQLRLPVQLAAGCQSCHAGSGVTATEVPAEVSGELTAFGEDWLSYGREWNPDIAAANSDGDPCANGFELGDSSGTWKPEDGYLVAPGNMDPSQADCTLPVDERSFGVLKSLFGD